MTQPSLSRSWPGLAVVALLCGIGGWSVLSGGGSSCSKSEPLASSTSTAPATLTTFSPRPLVVDPTLRIEDLEVGTGPEASSGDTVSVHYVGTLTDGKEFDSSRKHGQPFSFELGAGRVIKGWDQGVAGMRVGGKRKLTIPPDLAYGARGSPPVIPADATLVFEVEMLEVKQGAGKARPSDGDPLEGRFTMSDATKGLPGQGPLVATIRTSKGELRCRLYDDKAPVTVANFVGLATGKRAWKDPQNGQWVNRPAYDGTTFHRIIKGFMIQGGDPKGNGSGEPGYTIKDELWAGTKHDRAGLLCMANRGPNTNGAQFFIMDAAASHLDASYTIFGECSPVDVVHDIANVPTAQGDKPTTPVVIKSVTITNG
jgi:peptidyl-prolyl cis-trans isomerase A (cyclophilin A)